MISEAQFQNELQLIIQNGIREDIGEGDHSSLACIPSTAQGKAKLLVKDKGIIAGVEFARMIFNHVDADLKVETFIQDGSSVNYGDIVFHVSGSSQSILKAERLVLNSMQRMSAIATKTKMYVDLLKGTSTKVLDTRKTTPNFRLLEKEAVRIGGGINHRVGLYDMIMLKDNHIDYAGGLGPALERTTAYLKEQKLQLKVEVEVRSMEELDELLQLPINYDRIMLDNFTPSQLTEALQRIPKGIETEASGGITSETIRAYALTGVQFISVGALTHSVKALDMSLKAQL